MGVSIFQLYMRADFATPPKTVPFFSRRRIAVEVQWCPCTFRSGFSLGAENKDLSGTRSTFLRALFREFLVKYIYIFIDVDMNVHISVSWDTHFAVVVKSTCCWCEILLWSRSTSRVDLLLVRPFLLVHMPILDWLESYNPCSIFSVNIFYLVSILIWGLWMIMGVSWNRAPTPWNRWLQTTAEDQVAQPQQLREGVIFGEQQPSRVQVTLHGRFHGLLWPKPAFSVDESSPNGCMITIDDSYF
jgi:hypothetical protein